MTSTFRPRVFGLPRFLALPAVAAILSACTTPVIHTGVPLTTARYNEAPVASNFPTTTQLKLQATQHWMRIADDSGKALVELLKKGSMCSPSFKNCRSLYIKPPVVITEFSRAFHSQLITTLMKSGLAVSKEANAELLVEIDVQPILFAPNRPQYRHAGVPVELGPGVWAIRDVAIMDPNIPETTPPAKDALHWFRSEFAGEKTPQGEILVTVSVDDHTRYLARTTNAYYIPDADRGLYDHEICSLFHHCASETTARKITPTIGVTGDCPVERCRYDDVDEAGRAKQGAKK
jgi:hypothetical protein